MSLQLHRTYIAEEAIAAFGHGPNMLCDDQFAILPEVVLCFFTMGETKDEPHLRRSTEVVWIPGRLDYVPAKEKSTNMTAMNEFKKDGTIYSCVRKIVMSTSTLAKHIWVGMETPATCTPQYFISKQRCLVKYGCN